MTNTHGHVEALAGILLAHQRIPLYDGTYNQRCICGDMPASDGPNSPRHAAHVAEVLAAYVAEQQAQALRDAADYCTPKNWTGPAATLIHLEHWLRVKADGIEGKP